MTTSFTQNRALSKPAHNDDINTWDQPMNGNSDQIDASFGGVTAINVTSVSGTVVLSDDTTSPPSYICPILKLSGTLTANINYQFPTGIGGDYTVFNSTTGAFSVVFSSGGGGTTVIIPQGASAAISVDGTNVLLSDTMAMGASGQIQYNSSGVTAGSSKLIFDGTSLNNPGGNIGCSALSINGLTGGGTITSGPGGPGGISYFSFSQGQPDDTSWSHLCGYGAGGGGYNIVVYGNGNIINQNNSYGAISMRKLKQDIVPAASQVEDIKQIARMVSKYRLKANPTGPLQIGLIADDLLQGPSPGLVSVMRDYEMETVPLLTETGAPIFEEDSVTPVMVQQKKLLPTDSLHVNYSVLYMKAVKALGEMIERVEALEAALTKAGIPF